MRNWSLGFSKSIFLTAAARLTARHAISVRAALGLLILLRSVSAIAPRPLDMTEVGQELRRYDQYMEQVRGLAKDGWPCCARLRTAPAGSLTGACASLLCRPDKELQDAVEPGCRGLILARLLPWRATLGDRTHALVSALSYPANWQQASLPKSWLRESSNLKPHSAERTSMLRADAMVRCALDLGLRAARSHRLSLDDIDWEAGTITLRQTKGRREDVMPLPEATGKPSQHTCAASDQRRSIGWSSPGT